MGNAQPAIKPLQEVVDMLNAANDAGQVHRYEKFGTVWARPAVPGEVVVTTIGGKEETQRTASFDEEQVVITNAGGEEYIIGKDMLDKRYKLVGEKPVDDKGRLEYKAVGTAWAFTYAGPTFSFVAPWGEAMVAEDGDEIATTALGSTDVYRIEKGAFAKTYQRADA